MRFKDFFTGDFETSDTHEYQELRTRYYRCRPDKVVSAIREVCDEERMKVTGITSLNEVTIESVNFYAVLTVIEPVPMESAVDIKITTNHGIFDFGRGPKYIKDLYASLDKKLPFKGVSLYK